MSLRTKFGLFEAHTYQNLINKGYIIALAKGDFKANVLYTRVHSSCVTSETLGSMDCDCVHQLDGALKKIEEKGSGILFYLIQEGRGCGYIGKSRSCMMVQYHEDKITTFDAYKKLGMKNDYRDYSNIKEVIYLLGLEDKNFALLTNNPDKIKGLQEIGVKVSSVESIEVEPGPFNQAYLVSKEKMGHLLYKTKTKLSKYSLDYEKVIPFVPHALKGCSRFVFCASYYIPIKPLNNQMIYTKEELVELSDQGVSFDVIHRYANQKILVCVDQKDIHKVKVKPYWFKVHMYYDLSSQSDYVVLTYGDMKNKTPHVRVHSESLFNRFPLEEKIYSEKYKNSVESIVLNNSGVIVLLYHDGKGSGLGHYVINQTSDKLKTGTPHDSRDFDAAALLLEHHIPSKNLNILFSSSSRTMLRNSLLKQKFKIVNWIDTSIKNIDKGHQIISQRIAEAPDYLLAVNKQTISLSESIHYYILGIGSSKAHANYFCYLAHKYYKKVRVSSIDLSQLIHLDRQGSVLIVMSQGLSPNIQAAFSLWDYENIILYTSVTTENKDNNKRNILKRLLKNKNQVIEFPLEDEYTTLIRIVGPLCGYMAIYKSLRTEEDLSLSEEKALLSTLKQTESCLVDKRYFKSLENNPNVVFLLSYPLKSLFKNIHNKFIEGGFFPSVKAIDYNEFAHGYYQNIAYQRNSGSLTHFIVLNTSEFDDRMIASVEKMLPSDLPVWNLNLTLQDDFKILELEMIMNYFILKWLEIKNIDQVNWAGKEKQKYLYNLNEKDLFINH